MIIWWVVIFAVLPWGVTVSDNPEPGHAPSAPENPMLWRKAAITTVIATILWGIAYYVIEADLIPVRVS